jgi:uncharacterized protein
MMKRRDFIRDLSFVAGGLALASGSLGKRVGAFSQTQDLSAFRAAGYGPLTPTAAKNTGETFLSLPKGFEYNVLGRVKDLMSDGRPTPAAHDGMHAFIVGKELRVVRNHEVTGGRIPKVGSAIGSKNHYDATAGGGTTTLVIDPRSRTMIRDFVSLSGTLVNCAGGPTPWGSWISCEETTIGQTKRTSSSGVVTGGFPKPHGYCFEVPAGANSEVEAIPLKAMGRFEHEAIAVDRRTGVVYQTEDFASSGFFRFIPKRKGRLVDGGVLQMLAVANRPKFDSRVGQTIGAGYEAIWVTIDDPDPIAADTERNAVFQEGFAKGGAVFARLEGCDIDKNGRVYFTATSGGDKKGGQIWSYEPTGSDKGRLTLVFESPDPSVLHMPDNICLMPGSNMIMICEDGDYGGQRSVNHLRILTPSGKIADFAQNVSKDFTRSEFAGSTFSPDGSTLFVNIQLAGVTLAIWGDWSRFRS